MMLIPDFEHFVEVHYYKDKTDICGTFIAHFNHLNVFFFYIINISNSLCTNIMNKHHFTKILLPDLQGYLFTS